MAEFSKGKRRRKWLALCLTACLPAFAPPASPVEAQAKAMLDPSTPASAASGAERRMFEVLGVCRKALRKSEQDVADATRKPLEYFSRLRRVSGGLNLETRDLLFRQLDNARSLRHNRLVMLNRCLVAADSRVDMLRTSGSRQMTAALSQLEQVRLDLSRFEKRTEEGIDRVEDTLRTEFDAANQR